jgi:hypothetical protein
MEGGSIVQECTGSVYKGADDLIISVNGNQPSVRVVITRSKHHPSCLVRASERKNIVRLKTHRSILQDAVHQVSNGKLSIALQLPIIFASIKSIGRII